MWVILNELDRVIAISHYADVQADRVMIDKNNSIMGRGYRAIDVANIPSEVVPGRYFYRNNEFIVDPTRVDPTLLMNTTKKVTELDQQLNDKPIETMTLDEYKKYRRKENNELLADYLEAHPIKWTNGKLYGITKEDQDELTGNLTAYSISNSLGIDSELKWHAVGSECEIWTPEELTKLALAIKATVVPIVAVCQRYKVMILACTSKKGLEELVLDYSDEYMTTAIAELS